MFFYDKKMDKVIDIMTCKLEPGESTPLPDCDDAEMQQKAKIAVRPSKCRKWSQEFKVDAMKRKCKAGMNTEWPHYQTYSILRKEATSQPQVFDFLLMPPLIVKNCLPTAISVELTEQKSGEEEAKDKYDGLRVVILDR